MASDGDCIADRYTLREMFTLGGEGLVWRATDEVLGRDVVLKCPRTGDTGRYAVAAALAATALWSAAVPATAATPDPSTLVPDASRSEARTVVGQVASGSAGRYQLPDPGPYPNREECEKARAK
ncbi:hypothetical protein [Nocardia brasiliensis]|uniref:hypothetical protein n=1 Tax=Nocardia brasiliensis TaxID=37326 RepID=UPI0033C80D5D